MRSIHLPATTKVIVLANLQGRYDWVYYRSIRGQLKCISLVPRSRSRLTNQVV